MKYKIAVLSIAVMLMSCKEKSIKKTQETKQESAMLKDTDYRPNFHFTPEENWMNDPNGMFYLEGTYHLFYQYYPEGNTWGPMHWGHAVSKDMIKWEHKPIALFPDEKGYIFSGCAVVDHHNTSGLGDGNTPPIIAFFTYHDPEGEKAGKIDYQTQALAYSLDKGETWVKYKDNPVINNPGIKDFRDPNVIWDEAHKQWVLVLSADDKTMIYTSKDLLNWKHTSNFGEGIAAHGGVWECPDFFPMQVEGSNETKWVLIQSLNPGGYNDGSGTQYFVGDFDGENFIPEAYIPTLGEKHDFWLDFGKDNYAGVLWDNTPDNRILFIGWMSNWEYANVVPTETWRSTMTVARELSLYKDGEKYRIISKPVEELGKYEKLKINKEKTQVSKAYSLINKDEVLLNKTRISFEIPNLKKQSYDFLLTNEMSDSLTFGYNHSKAQFYIDRSKSGRTSFSEDFAKKPTLAPRLKEENILKVDLLLDKTSIEVFYDDGYTIMTDIFFPKYPFQEFKVLSEEEFQITNFKVYQVEL